MVLPGNGWWRFNDSDTVFVFVHGILSNAKDCWSASNGTFWPDLVYSDPRFGKPALYLVEYYTAIGSGNYGIEDAARDVYARLNIPDVVLRQAVMTKPKIVFIAHSTGGLVVRSLLVHHAAAFAAKQMGVVLVASPSRGSEWANQIRHFTRAIKNKMADQLRRDDPTMHNLDNDFAEIWHRNAPTSRWIGLDLFENRFVVRLLRIFTRTLIVDPTVSTSYFGRANIVPNTDHFSIAKPDNVEHPSHIRLVDFFLNDFATL